MCVFYNKQWNETPSSSLICTARGQKHINTVNSSKNSKVQFILSAFNNKHTPGPANVGVWMQLKSLRLACSTRSLRVSSTTCTLFSWRCRSRGSRVAKPPGLASANRRSSWVAVEMAWPGGSSLWDKMEWWRHRERRLEEESKGDDLLFYCERADWSDSMTVKELW